MVRRALTAVPGKPENSIDLDEIRQRAIARTMLMISKPPIQFERKGDGLDWARKIIVRANAGERIDTLPMSWATEVLAKHKPQREPGDDDADAAS